MNFRVVLKYTGKAVSMEALLMLFPLLVSFVYNTDDAQCFVIPMVIICALCLPCYLIRAEDRQLYAKEGFAIVALSWIGISLFGALPYYLCGKFPSFIDCFFESISGFTTTGATILTNVEMMSKSILFWRSLTLWVGGMGVLVFTMALLPTAGGQALHIIKAESPGPTPGKLVPKLSESSKILYIIYAGMTLILMAVLILCGMPAYDAITTAFSAAGTGGFSNLNANIGGYNSPLIEMVLGFSIFIYGINFGLIFYFIKREFAVVKADQELKFYLAVVAASTALIAFNLILRNIYMPVTALRHSFFQVSSVITTTGFSTANYDLWPSFSKTILFILMFIGGSSGSTAGAMKCIRILILLKLVVFEISKAIHPRAVHTMKINGKKVNEPVARGVLVFTITYMLIFIGALLLVSIDGFDMETNFSSVALSLGNVGIGFGVAGPTGSFLHFSSLSKLVFSFCMLVGRLEIFPILLLFMPAFWKRVNI